MRPARGSGPPFLRAGTRPRSGCAGNGRDPGGVLESNTRRQPPKSEIRGPKPERRPNTEYRIPNTEGRSHARAFRISGFGLLSALGFRASGLGLRAHGLVVLSKTPVLGGESAITPGDGGWLGSVPLMPLTRRENLPPPPSKPPNRAPRIPFLLNAQGAQTPTTCHGTNKTPGDPSRQ
jgi:hypothetical protein